MIGSIEDEAAMLNINRVISAIDQVRRPIPNFTYLKSELQRNGLRSELADWLSTSVRYDLFRPTSRRGPDRCYEFVYTTKIIRELLKTYREADYWDIFGNPPEGCHIRLVRAERNPLWTEDLVERLEILSADRPESISTRLVKNAGHWLQVDNPQGLHEAISDLL